MFDPIDPATWTDEDWAAAFAFESDGGDVAAVVSFEVAA